MTQLLLDKKLLIQRRNSEILRHEARKRALKHTVTVQADTIAAQADTIAAQADKLTVQADTIAAQADKLTVQADTITAQADKIRALEAALAAATRESKVAQYVSVVDLNRRWQQEA